MAAADPVPVRLARITLAQAQAQSLGAGELKLRRAWPRDENRLLLEYATPTGRIVGGQWSSDATLLEKVLRQTREVAPHARVFMAEADGLPIVLQADGADRVLPALAEFVQRTGGLLISHRIERRAVVRLDRPQTRFIKFVRSLDILQAAHDLGKIICDLPGRTFDAPAPLDMNRDELWVEWSALPGRSWRDAIIAAESPAFSSAVGRALREIHDAAIPSTVPVHGAADESRVLTRWVRHARLYDLVTDDAVRQAEAVTQALVRDPMPECLIHRDFHERQVVLSSQGHVGILDFDTLARGEAAIDLGNVLAHLDHAAKAGLAPRAILAAHAGAFLEGYGPSSQLLARTDVYRAGTLLRLECLHAFRP
jgi:aminoglycoside phosphotransferase